MQHEELTLSVLRNVENIKSQKSLANDLGLSVGKVNYVLRALIEKGFVKTENFFANKNKTQYKYLLTDQGIKEKKNLTEKFIDRKKKEYDEFVLELESLNGRSK